MKKLLMFFCFVILNITSQSQIILEHTFTSNNGVLWFFTNTRGIMYYAKPDTLNNEVKIFNQDYSLYKTVIINRPVGYVMYISYISEQVFNIDNSIEFVCTFLNHQNHQVQLIDENGTVIKDFGTYSYDVQPLLIYNNSFCKFMIRGIGIDNNQLIDEVYNVPGNMPNNISLIDNPNFQFAYPNPTNTIINLIYNLEKGQTSMMRIYNINGQLIEQKQIDSNFDRILLNVETYQPGFYLYEYNGVSNSFIVN